MPDQDPIYTLAKSFIDQFFRLLHEQGKSALMKAMQNYKEDKKEE